MVNAWNTIEIHWKLKVVEGESQWVDFPFYSDYSIIFHDSDKIIRTYTGLEWKIDQDNGYVKDIIPVIEQGLQKLNEHETEYQDVKMFFGLLIQSWKTLCSNPWNSQYKDILHFWVE